MAMMLFAILINQNIGRSLKDSLVHTMVGTEVISFIKLWGEMPLGILFVIIYSKLHNIMSSENVFRCIVIFFLGFYVFFAFILYPYQEYFHPSPEVISNYANLYPHIKYFIIMWGKWSFILIYIMAELWPMIVFALLFWQLANKITLSSEAKRFYPFFTLFGHANCLVAGCIMVYFSSDQHFLMPLFDNISDNVEVMIKTNVIIMTLSGVICLLLHRIIEKTIVLPNEKRPQTASFKTLNLGFIESLKLVIKSRYLCLLFFILVCYSIAINLIEGITMYQYKQVFQTAELFMVFQGKVLFWTGIVTIFGSLLGSLLLQRFGWVWGAILTPLAMVIFSGIFFFSVIFRGEEIIIKQLFGTSPVMLSVFLGSMQFAIFKGLKYSL